jgi:hypothetical protein
MMLPEPSSQQIKHCVIESHAADIDREEAFLARLRDTKQPIAALLCIKHFLKEFDLIPAH